MRETRRTPPAQVHRRISRRRLVLRAAGASGAIVALAVLAGACSASSGPANGARRAARAAGPDISGLRVTHVPGGLPWAYKVSGEVDGTYGGHTILMVNNVVTATGQKFTGFKLDSGSCKVRGNRAYATGRFTNTLGRTVDFSFTADFVNQEADGSMVSQTSVATAAYQVYHVPPGGTVAFNAIGTVYPGTATGPKFGCDYYNDVAADSHAHYPY